MAETHILKDILVMIIFHRHIFRKDFIIIISTNNFTAIILTIQGKYGYASKYL